MLIIYSHNFMNSNNNKHPQLNIIVKKKKKDFIMLNFKNNPISIEKIFQIIILSLHDLSLILWKE